MKSRGIILWIVLFVAGGLLPAESSAQAKKGRLQLDELSLIIKNWTIKNGLPVNSINQITQDDEGYLWLTTYDGLVRFDGLNFKVYNYANTPQMVQNRTTHMYFQEGTGLWVALENGGLLLKTGEAFRYFGAADGFTDSDVKNMFTDGNGRLYFLTLDGLYTYDGNGFTQQQAGNWASQNQIISAFIDPVDNSIWLPTPTGVLHSISKSESELIVFSDNSQPGTVFDVARDDEKNLIVGTEKGIYRVAGGRLMPSGNYADLADLAVYRFWPDSDTLYISTSDGLYQRHAGIIKKIKGGKTAKGIKTFYKDRKQFKIMVDNNGIPFLLLGDELVEAAPLVGREAVELTGFFEGKEPGLWVATLKDGLFKFTTSKVQTIGAKEGLSGDNILGLLEDTRGRYWVGTRNNGLNMIDGNTVTHFDRKSGLASDIVHTVAEDSSGNIWVGYLKDGIDKLENGRITHYNFSEDLETNDVHAIYTASDGTLWAGTYNGLIHFNPDFSIIKKYGKADGLADTKIRYVTEDKEGGIWVASLLGGITRIKNDIVTNYTTKDGMSSNNIRSIYIDDAGTVWSGSENRGVNRLKNGEIDFVAMDDGLPDHIIHWISEDEYGYLWFLSNRGVFRIKKTELESYMDGVADRFHVTSYDERYGMRSPEGNGAIQEAGLKTKDKKFWFATQQGIAIFERSNVEDNPFFPNIGISGLTADGTYYDADSLNTIRFREPVKALSVHFKAVTFMDPEQIKFRYKLADKEDTWTETAAREVTLVDLAPGDHTFLLQASNNEGFWSENTAKLNFYLPARFYQKPLFFILILMIAVIFYYLAVRISHNILIRNQVKMRVLIDRQTRQILNEKNELESQKMVIEKQAAHLREANRSKDKFFSIIGHDLRNPFQSLLGFSELIAKRIDTISKNELREAVDMIRSSAGTMYKLTEDLLKWASLQSGRVFPEPEIFPINEVTQRNEDLMQLVAAQKDISLKTHVDGEIIVFADKNMVDTIIRNLISNAIKFTPRGGSVELSAITAKKKCYVTVKDSGFGMSPEYIVGVLNLDSHVTRAGTENESGSGLGLILCHEMAVLNKGSLKIESAVGEGTSVSFDIPLADESLQ